MVIFCCTSDFEVAIRIQLENSMSRSGGVVGALFSFVMMQERDVMARWFDQLCCEKESEGEVVC